MTRLIHCRCALALPVVLLAAAGAEAEGWGPNGHAATTYDVATRKEFRLPPDVAKVLALGSMSPDYFDFDNPAAHAQTDDPRISVEGGNRFKLVDGTRMLEETSAQWRERSERWHDHYFNASIKALESGQRERAAILLGYALHNREDYATHEGMPNIVHALLSSHLPTNPDQKQARLERAGDYAAGDLARFRVAVGEDNWKLFRGEAVSGTGRVGSRIPEPTNVTDLQLQDWDPRSGILPPVARAAPPPPLTPTALEADLARRALERGLPLATHYKKDANGQINEGLIGRVENTYVGFYARQEQLADLLDTTKVGVAYPAKGPPGKAGPQADAQKGLPTRPKPKDATDLATYAGQAILFDKGEPALLKDLSPADQRMLIQQSVRSQLEWRKSIREKYKAENLRLAKWRRDTEPRRRADKPASGVRKWVLPKSPGGIALSPGLELPGGLGTVTEVALDEDEVQVVLVTSTGKYAVDYLDPQTFATVLRTVAGGEVPFVTIGTEPSGREGYAKVTGTPSLQGTREGAVLYRADIQFKAIFAHFAFGDVYTLNTPDDPLLRGYPGRGGESARYWITSSGMRLKRDNGRLVTDRHGLRILGETTLRGEVVPDPTLDAYTRNLTEHWDEIADQLEEFRAVQDLALATGLAFWVREHRVPVNDAVWTLPARDAATPEYSPAVVYKTGGVGVVTGGVCLTPEEKSRGPGRTLLFLLATVLDEAEQGGVSPGLVRLLFGLATAVTAAAAVLFWAGVFWLIGKWTLRGTGEPLGYWRVVRTWLLVLASQALVAVVVWFVTSGDWLSHFDNDFLAFAATFGVAPFLLLFWVRRAGPALGNLGTHLARRTSGKVCLVLLSLMMPSLAGLLGGTAALLTVAVAGPLPGPTMEQILTVELAPSEVLGRLAGAGVSAPAGPSAGGRPAPTVMRSLRQAWAEPFRHEATSGGSEHADEIRLDGSQDPAIPVRTLQRIRWPADRPVPADGAHYSPDGKPPF